MFCIYCGNLINDNMKFCTSCGKPVSTDKMSLNKTTDDTVALETRNQVNNQINSRQVVPLKNELTRGMILGDTYEILDEIGAGGGGVVYKARHKRLEIDVVVKKIKDSVLDKVKIRQEADILKRLKHPYLPRVYDFIDTETGVFTVMDFIDGDTVEDIVKRYGRLDQNLVKKWAEQLGEALSYLHSQNPPIIHSDIKPANIMITKNNDVCLIDFNISLAIDSSLEYAVGVSRGFSPPEQYRDPVTYSKLTNNYALYELLSNGNSSISRKYNSQENYDGRTEVLSENNGPKLSNRTSSMATTVPYYTQYMGGGIDARSDIYSLGVTLYHMLTGIVPQVEFGNTTPLEECNIPISEGFLAILNKMMELAPTDRYADGTEFLHAIKNCYKLDKRYISMHRKELLFSVMGSLLIALGIIIISMGIFLNQRSQKIRYYELVSEVEESIDACDWDETWDNIEAAKEIKPLQIDAYQLEIKALYFNGNYDECISQGIEYINSSPFKLVNEYDKQQLGDIYYLVGNAYFEISDYSNACQLFETAIEYDDSNGAFYRDYAIALAKLGKIDTSEKILKKARKLELSDESIYMVEGEVHSAKGEYDQAIECFNSALDITDDSFMRKRAIFLLVDTYRKVGDSRLDDEIDLLETYSSKFEAGEANIINEYLADAYMRKAQATDDMTYYEQALDLFKDIKKTGFITYQLDENIAILYENLDMLPEAEEQLLQMVQDYPKRYEVYKRLALLEADKQQSLLNEDRDYSKMKEYYEKACEMYSDSNDVEMAMLEKMIEELADGGWF